MYVSNKGSNQENPNGGFVVGKTYKTILCPIDFSQHSANALKEAVKLDGIHKGKFVLAHIVVNPWSALYETKTKETMKPKEILELVQTMVKDFVEETVPGLSYEPYIDIDDHISGKIIQCAKETRADLIVLSCFGLNGDRKYAMGSVAENIVRRAPCSVFLVRD